MATSSDGPMTPAPGLNTACMTDIASLCHRARLLMANDPLETFAPNFIDVLMTIAAHVQMLAVPQESERLIPPIIDWLYGLVDDIRQRSKGAPIEEYVVEDLYDVFNELFYDFHDALHPLGFTNVCASHAADLCIRGLQVINEGPQAIASELPGLLWELSTNLDLIAWEPEGGRAISDTVRDLTRLAGLLDEAAGRIRSSQISQHNYERLVGLLSALLYKVLGPLVPFVGQFAAGDRYAAA